MMQIAITIILNLVSFYCLAVGIYILFLNNNKLNKLTFLISVALTCYSFSISQILNASTVGDAINWRKIAAISALSGFAFLLEFVFYLTASAFVKKYKWIDALIYAPTVVFTYIIASAKSYKDQIFPFREGAIGWILLPGKSSLFYFFNFYIFISLLLGIGLLVKWKMIHSDFLLSQNTKELYEKKKTNVILVSYIIAVILFVICQGIFYLIENPYIYLVSPVLIPIPVTLTLLSVVKYQFLQEKYVDIIMEQYRTKLGRYLSGAYILGGFIYFATQYFGLGIHDINHLMPASILLFSFGLIIFILQNLNLKKEYFLCVLSIIITVTVPFVTLNFASSAAITVWSFSIIIIIACVLLDTSEIFIMVSAATIVTQIYMWIFVHPIGFYMDDTDYFGRILIFCIAAQLVSYINKVYITRLHQLTTNKKNHDILFEISTNLLDINKYNKSGKIAEIISFLGDSVKANRVFVCYEACEADDDKNECYVWTRDTLEKEVEEEEQKLLSETWWKKELDQSGFLNITDMEDLPPEANEVKEILKRQNTKRMIAVPMNGNSMKTAYLRVDLLENYVITSDELIQTLSTIGNILGKAIDKQLTDIAIEKMAYYDQLTQIPNRNLFEKYTDQWIKYSLRNKTYLGILFLDMDSFKNINDISGHNFGDQVLIQVAKKIQNCLRNADIVGRFGGDEFVIMIHQFHTKADIEKVAKKIMEQFKKPIVIDDNELNVTVSIGISIFPEDGSDVDTLIKNADIAMYRAKKDGKNKYVCCSEQLKQELSEEITISNQLYKVLEKKEFQIVYQPQIKSHSGELVAVEALLRWNNSVLGNVSPAIFIPIAEKIGIISDIGEWVMFQACKQNKLWQDAGYKKIRVAVNVSVNQIIDKEFPATVKSILRQTGLEPQYLEIEITEHVAIQELHVIVNTLTELKRIGISIAIDDFGVEYSSLTRIKDLPIDRIKLDMQFIKNILINEKERKITNAIIDLAKNLNLLITAEGVEEKEQFLYLKERKCDEIQGYYFYRPLSVTDLEKVLQQKN